MGVPNRAHLTDGAAIAEYSEEKRFRHDRISSEEIAHWAYSQLERFDGRTWMARDKPTVLLSPKWRAFLST